MPPRSLGASRRARAADCRTAGAAESLDEKRFLRRGSWTIRKLAGVLPPHARPGHRRHQAQMNASAAAEGLRERGRRRRHPPLARPRPMAKRRVAPLPRRRRPGRKPRRPPRLDVSNRRFAAAGVCRLCPQRVAAFGGPLQLPPPANPTGPLLLSGHQPTLFHPGVWFKNFLLANLAASQSANAVNLIVDNDLCPPATIAVPTRLDGALTVVHEPFAEPAPRIPFEERLLTKTRTAANLPGACRPICGIFPRPVSSPPLIASFPDLSAWRAAVLPAAPPSRSALHSPPSAANLNTPRRHQPRTAAWSSLPKTASFRSFSLSLLAICRGSPPVTTPPSPPIAGKTASAAKPIRPPIWKHRAAGCEAPLWIWTTENPTRRRLFVRTFPNRMQWTDLQGWRAELTTPDSLHDDRFQSQWAVLEAAGVKLRAARCSPRSMPAWFCATCSSMASAGRNTTK